MSPRRCGLFQCPVIDTSQSGNYQASGMKRALVVALYAGLLGLASCGKEIAFQRPPPPVAFAAAKAESVALTIDTFGKLCDDRRRDIAGADRPHP